MAELGSTAVAGPITSGLTPAGAGVSPSSAQSLSQGALASTLGDGGDIGLSRTATTQASLVSVIGNDATDVIASVLQSTNTQLYGMPGLVKYYQMEGMDKNVDGLYDTWIVTGAEDLTGAHYQGPRATPLRSITISSSWVR